MDWSSASPLWLVLPVPAVPDPSPPTGLPCSCSRACHPSLCPTQAGACY